MFVADCEEWVDMILPNLPKEYHDEYILKLAEFKPDCPIEKTFLPYKFFEYWVFPFVDVDSDFPQQEYEEHMFAVESEMIQKYHILDENSFCS